MTPDHPDNPDEHADDFPVLGDAATPETAVLGFLGGVTAQVSVSLPAADEDDLADDDVIGDEVVFDDEPDAADAAAAAEPEAVEPEVIEPVPVYAEADDEPVDAEIDEDDQAVEDPGYAAGDPHLTSAEYVRAAEAAYLGTIPAAKDEDDDGQDEPGDTAADAASVADDVEPGITEPEGTGSDIADSGEPEAGESERADSGAQDSGPADSEPADSEPERAEPDAISAEAGDAATEDSETGDDRAGAADDEVVAPTAQEGASMDDRRPARAHDVERVHTRPTEVSFAAKRLDQFDSDKETSDLLTADRLLEPGKVGGGEPEGLWQHLIYSISGGRINLGDGKRARARKELTARIAGTLTGGAKFVPVLSRKGGVGKTTITTLLGMALADARDDRIIAIDANPDRGTLAERIARPSGKTVRDLARMKDDITGYNDVSSIVARDETRLDVLASDADPRVSEAFSDTDYQDVATLAAHYYSIVLTDTGTGIVHSVMGATLGLADQLVVVSGLSIDEARLASETLTWLETNGYAALVRTAVVVLNNARPGAPLVREDELEAHFSTRVRAVVRMPYDPQIATGSAIAFRDLHQGTRDAARELALAVVEGLRGLAAAA